MQTQINLAISLVAYMPSTDSDQPVYQLVTCMPSTNSDQPGHQPSGLYAQYRLRSTCSISLVASVPVQTQINLSISLVACMPQYRLRSTCLSAWWHVCPVQTLINMSISQVACVPSADSYQPVHQPSDMCAQCRLISTCPSA